MQMTTNVYDEKLNLHCEQSLHSLTSTEDEKDLVRGFVRELKELETQRIERYKIIERNDELVTTLSEWNSSLLIAFIEI